MGRTRSESGRVPARRVGLACLLVAASILIGSAPASIATTRMDDPPRYRHLTAGVKIRRILLPGPVRLLQLRIDLSRVQVEPVTATHQPRGYATLREVAQREHALLAVDGDLAADGAPAHLLLRDGILVTSGLAAGAAFVLDEQGQRAVVLGSHPAAVATRLDTGQRVVIARWNAGLAPGRRLSAFTRGTVPPTDTGVPCWAGLEASGNRSRFRVASTGCGSEPPSNLDLVLLAPRVSTSGRWVAALRPGVGIAVRLRSGLPVAAQGFGGWPALVHAGHAVSQPCGPLTCALHPRTAVGLTRACFDMSATTPCRLLVVVVDGRRLGWSLGMTTRDLAQALSRLGAYEAINLDGGASAQVLFHQRSLNRVSPGARRAVVSALIMRRRPVAAAIGPWPIARW